MEESETSDEQQPVTEIITLAQWQAEGEAETSEQGEKDETSETSETTEQAETVEAVVKKEVEPSG